MVILSCFARRIIPHTIGPSNLLSLRPTVEICVSDKWRLSVRRVTGLNPISAWIGAVTLPVLSRREGVESGQRPGHVASSLERNSDSVGTKSKVGFQE